MLSVLIPSYDQDVLPLFHELHRQLSQAKIDFEIICIDNASKSDLCITNQKANELSHCQYLENEQDVGRSAIRNQLASMAKHPWLLFLDDDVMPTDTSFIETYQNYIQKGNTVVCGGLRYESDSPKKNFLRYAYGIRHEQVPSAQRQANPYKYFLASNLLISKEVFDAIRFNEKVTKYGYEDLLFSRDLKSKGISILHVDNPVYHLGIDTNEVFIGKTEHALENMVVLKKKGILTEIDTRIFETYQRFKRLGLLGVVRRMKSFFKSKALDGSLFFFNFYRLSYLSTLLKDSE
ncbi:MAG: glycosyl transferase [Flavobacteriaceae bacterium]|nr:glycosyl transferase [Flavobacteriaceae bacterium]|tara:strand:- start:35454 stop:36329 length:876 start_codon:yes stop_codon:yes gene_type:complete